MAVRGVAAGHWPSPRPLCECRRRQLPAFKRRFVEGVRVASELGGARLGQVSMDGSKGRAPAAKRPARRSGRRREEERRRESESGLWRDRARAVDEAEAERFGQA